MTGTSRREDDDTSLLYELLGLRPPLWTHQDIADLTGVAHDTSVRWWRAMGFPESAPDDRIFTDDDVEMVAALKELFAEGVLDNDQVLRLARLTGSSFARLASAQLDLLADEVTDPSDGADHADGLIETLRADDSPFATVEATMSYVWRRHMLAAILARTSLDEGETPMAVGFSDLSGFSKFSKSATTAELTTVIDTFEASVFDIIADHDGHVVKFLGDGVLFTAVDISTAVDIVVELTDRLSEVELIPPLHSGVATGPIVTIGGDVFGHAVNLASRLSAVARPGTLLVERSDAECLGSRSDIEHRTVRRSYHLSGIGRTQVVSLRPLGPANHEPEVDQSEPV